MEVELFLGCIKVKHQVEHHFVHFIRTAIRFVDLVNNHDRFQSDLQSLLKHKAGLGHRTFESIDQKQYAISHVKHAFNLTTKVGVTRGVDDIYFKSFVVDRDVFGENGNPSFTFEVVVVHDKLAGIFIFTEKVSREEHFVHEGSFAMVNMGNNSNVSDFLHLTQSFLRPQR